MPRKTKEAKTTKVAKKAAKSVKKVAQQVDDVAVDVDELDDRVAELESKHDGDSVEVVKKVKVKRAPSAYNLFVKDKMQDASVKALPPKERMGAIGALWKAQKSS